MNTTDIRSWLEVHGLEEFATVFEENHITPDMMSSLTGEDLSGMGITSLGHRKMLLTAMGGLDASNAIPPPADPLPSPSSVSLPPPSGFAFAPPPQQLGARAPYTQPEAVPWQQPYTYATEEIQPPAPASDLSKKEKRKGFSASFLAVSVALHVLLGLGAGYWVVQQINAKRKLQFTGGPPTVSPSKRALEHKVSLQKKKNAGGAPAQARRIAVTGLAAKVTLPEMPAMPNTSTQIVAGRMAGMGGAGFGTGMGFGNGSGMGVGGMGNGGLGLTMFPPAFKGRCNPADRIMQLAKNGGTAAHEAAVSKTLDWLKGKQNSDGSWGRRYQVGMTGFALLTYLGRCATPDDPQYGETVMKAILYLVENSKKNGNGMLTEQQASNGSVYEHGIATYALGEMYAIARLGKKQLPGMREAFEQGVEVIIARQRADGGWRYFTEESGATGASDLSVTGWQYQALKAAKLTELKISGLEKCIDKTVEYLRSKHNAAGGFGNPSREAGYNQYALSGVGIVGLQALDKNGSRPQVRKGMDFTMDMFKAEPPSWDTNCNIYAWYYYTQACFQAGGNDWRYWNETAMPQILAAQNPDGSWKAEGPSLTHSVVFKGGIEGEIYRACLCTLMLEIYYRYLKVN